MGNIRILISSPVKQGAEILHEFLFSLDRLNKQGVTIDYYFIDDNNEELSKRILSEFVKKSPGSLIRDSSYFSLPVACDYITGSSHYWKKSLIERIILFKNDMINRAIENYYDYIFLIDSDILLDSRTLIHLLSRNIDIVSEVFWTRWDVNSILVPQVWLQDKNEYYRKDWDQELSDEEIIQKSNDFINALKIPGLYEVGGLGACTLISRKALLKGVNFDLIDNVSFWGEDRHFCIRARVLGLILYVDTVMPAYHIYRKAEIAGVDAFYKVGYDPNVFIYDAIQKYTNKLLVKAVGENIETKIIKIKRLVRKLIRAYIANKRIVKSIHTLTVSMIVRNESSRYLEEVLIKAKSYADNFVIIDDASTDGTPDIIRSVLEGCRYTLIINNKSLFDNEVILRKKLWLATIESNPDWILFLDADEIIEENIISIKKWLLENNSVDAYCFRLYDMWTNECYRDDEHWSAHTRYVPFMIRYQPWFKYKYKNTKQHCGRIPMNILLLPYAKSDLRIKHLGWLRENDRKQKYYRYMELDPQGYYGDLKQYQSILDSEPNLKKY